MNRGGMREVLSMSGIKLYSVSDSPPSFAVRLGLEALGLPYSVVEVDYAAGEHLTAEYAKKNPQKEIPCLDDNGFLLSESIAILQYLGDKYDKDGKLYYKDPQQRAAINHRLAFNISTYYKNISEYVVAPIFYAYEQTPLGLKKLKVALSVFNTILENQGTKYAAGETLTIGDLPLVTATMCLEATNFDFSEYSHITRWYANFKKEYPKLWAVAEPAMKELHTFYKNPPDLSALNHPFHPARKQ
ncbi:glutathione S-transferase 1 isoform X2 [Anabrus simplex]|uniref:glutathione S-transferase 1 isoform X2 n=1 Tax=Anabrus simplex TaxID=316456 RepID=UPI0034DD8B9E